MYDGNWCVFSKFPNYSGAEVLKAHLESEGVPTKIAPSGKLTSLHSEVLVLVEKSLLHRAKWIMKNSEFSEEELAYLATGELPSSEKEK